MFGIEHTLPLAVDILCHLWYRNCSIWNIYFLWRGMYKLFSIISTLTLYRNCLATLTFMVYTVYYGSYLDLCGIYCLLWELPWPLWYILFIMGATLTFVVYTVYYESYIDLYGIYCLLWELPWPLWYIMFIMGATLTFMVYTVYYESYIDLYGI